MARKVSGGWMLLCCLIVALESATLCQRGSSEGSHQDCSQDDKITLLYQKLEGALINNSKALFQLKRIFFSVGGTDIQEVEVFFIQACVRVGVTEHFQSPETSANSSNGTHTSTHCWNFKWSASALLSFITVDQLMAIDYIYVNWIYSQIRGKMIHRMFLIALNTDLLSSKCIPSEKDIKEVLIQLLSWAKAYARAQGRPQTWEERDRGYLSSWYNYWTSVREDSGCVKADYIRKSLILLYISLNLFILLMFMIGGNQCREKLTALRSKQLSHAYLMALLIGMTLFNTTYALTFLYGFISKYPTVWATMKGSQSSQNPPIPTGTRVYKDEEITLILKYITLPVTVIIELFLAMKIRQRSRFPLPSLTVKLCCYCCRCCSVRLKFKTLQTLIWWNVMVFIQLLVGHVAMPVLILFTIAPADTISVIGTVALLYIYIAIAVVYLVQIIRYHCSWKKCGLACAELFGLIAFLALMASLFYFYNAVLKVGSNFTSVNGLVVSLIPSAILSLTAWLIKKLLSRRRHDRFITMESVTGDRVDGEEMDESRVLTEEQRNLLESESESEDFDSV